MKSFFKFSVCVLILIVMLYSSTSAFAAITSISPGILWYDSTGKLINAHGGGLLKVASTYYWYGEDHTNGYPSQTVSCYSSIDLVNWKFENYSLSTQTSGDLATGRVIERPKVIYNSYTKKYVMYMHIDNTNYSDAKVGVAICDTPNGQFKYINSFRPNNHQSRDMTLFQDGTNAWLVSLGENDAGSINKNVRIFPLTSDYLTVLAETYTFVDAGREGLAVMKAGGYYFIVSSGCTGWSPNQQKYTYSTSMNSGWNTTWKNLGDSSCYKSQSNFLLPVQGTEATSYIYMGDRWNSSNLSDSRYIWLPLKVNGTSLTLDWTANWTINASTGAITNKLTGPWYKIKNVKSGKFLDVTSSSIDDGASIVQWTDNGGYNQQWMIVTTGSYKRIINRWSGKVLSVMGSSAADGALIGQYTDTGAANQQWTCTDIGGGIYKIINHNSGKLMDVSGGSTSDGGKIIQWMDNGGQNQQWTLITAP